MGLVRVHALSEDGSHSSAVLTFVHSVTHARCTATRHDVIVRVSRFVAARARAGWACGVMVLGTKPMLLIIMRRRQHLTSAIVVIRINHFRSLCVYDVIVSVVLSPQCSSTTRFMVVGRNCDVMGPALDVVVLFVVGSGTTGGRGRFKVKVTQSMSLRAYIRVVIRTIHVIVRVHVVVHVAWHTHTLWTIAEANFMTSSGGVTCFAGGCFVAGVFMVMVVVVLDRN